MNKLRTLRLTALQGALPGACPFGIVDYRRFPNPYIARYGEQEWENEIRKSLSKYCCVKELVKHINEESRKAFLGTCFEGNYYFYHDALTQMTDSKCVHWMKAEGIYDHWIRPELGCNDEIYARNSEGTMAKNTRYKGRPVGNSPELNPLDNSCFRDTRTNLALNVAATWHLDKSDARKFSLSTPNEITRALERTWDPENGCAPSSDRILQDIKRIPKACLKIAANGGKIVPGLADRNGHRRAAGGNGNNRRFSFVQSRTLETIGIHHSIRELVTEQYENEKDRFFGDLERQSVLTDASIEIDE